MRRRFEACGKPVVLVNVDKLQGRIGLRQGWVHASRWARHRPIVMEDQ